MKPDRQDVRVAVDRPRVWVPRIAEEHRATTRGGKLCVDVGQTAAARVELAPL